MSGLLSRPRIRRRSLDTILPLVESLGNRVAHPGLLGISRFFRPDLTVMNGQNEEAETKWNNRPTLELFLSQELNRHPERVGQNPQQNGGIVAAFRCILPIFPE